MHGSPKCCQRNPELDTSESSRNRFYWGTLSMREKRPQGRTGCKSENSKDKWGFTVEEQFGDRVGEMDENLLRGNPWDRGGGFWLNRSNRILSEGRSGSSGITCRMVEHMEFDQISRVGILDKQIEPASCKMWAMQRQTQKPQTSRV